MENASKTTANKIVKLNIGGFKYTTFAKTLVPNAEEDNFFQQVLSGKVPVIMDEKGYYFIDRDGQYFQPLLELLRTGEFLVPNHLKVDAVLREAKFYNIKIPSNNLTGSLV